MDGSEDLFALLSDGIDEGETEKIFSSGLRTSWVGKMKTTYEKSNKGK